MVLKREINPSVPQVEGPLGFLNKDSVTASWGFGNTVPIERVPVVSCPT